MSDVYRGHDRAGAPVAIKVLRHPAPHLVERFEREIQVLGRLTHPAIVRYLDSGWSPDDGRPLLVMEWLEGYELSELLARGSLGLDTCLALGQRMAEALGEAHALGVVHRDVKPSNIFLPGGGIAEAKLLDFGIARWQQAGSLTQTGARFGTPAYMSPEQVRGARALDARADVFSLGCVLYECISGHPPFDARDSMAVFAKVLFQDAPRLSDDADEVPPALDELMIRLLARDPDARPANGRATAEALAALRREFDETTLTQPRRNRPRPRTLTRREQRLVSVILARLEVVRVSAAAPTAPGSAGPPGPVFLDAPTVDAEPSPFGDSYGALRAQLEGWGLSCHMLDSGFLVAVLQHGDTHAGVVGDQGAAAARAALALRAAYPQAQIALATGRAVVERAHSVGAVIERAADMLTHPLAAAAAGVYVDTITHLLVRESFRVEGDEEGGFVLERERVARPTQGRALPFVGRRGELATLRATLAECCEDEVARAVLITGPAGFGKTRLCNEFLAAAAAADLAPGGATRRGGAVTVWRAYGDPVRAGLPLHMFAAALTAAAGLGAGPADEQRARLRAYVAGCVAAAEAERVSAFLGELLHLGPDEEVLDAASDDSAAVQLRAARRDRKLMGDQVRRACRDVLAAVLDAGPVVFVLEDLHWGDRATLEVLDWALHELAACPLMVLGLARPELGDLRPTLWGRHGVTELRLHRLPRRVAEKLVRAGLGADASPEWIDRLVQRADGNPYFIEELIRRDPSSTDTLPETVAAVVEARLGALAPDARHILRAASILGRSFWEGAVIALVGDRIDVPGWLEALMAFEIIDPADGSRFAGEREYRFRHDLLREGAYHMLVEDDRRLGHRLAGAWLEMVGELDARVLANHFERGGDPERAAPFYLLSAERALGRSDLDEAVLMASRGLACGAEGPLLGALYRVQMEERIWRGHNADVARLGEAAMPLLSCGSREWFDVVGEVAMARVKLGQIDQLAELLDQLDVGQIPGHDRVGWLIASAKLATLSYVAGLHEPGEALFTEIEQEMDENDWAEPVVAAHQHLCRAFRAEFLLADPAAVLSEELACVACFERVGDLRQISLHRGNVGHARIELGLYEHAEADLRAAIDIAERLTLELAANNARQKLTLALARRGAFGEARALGQRARDWFAAQGDTRMAGLTQVYLALVSLLEGSLDGAEREAGRLIQEFCEQASVLPAALAIQARARLLRGDTETALTLATRAMSLAERADKGELDRPLIQLAFAEALLAHGDQGRARATLGQARTELQTRARAISRDDWRQSFLEHIPEHAQILQLADAWLDAGDGAPTEVDE